MKKCSAEQFLENLGEIVFQNFLAYTCVSDAYSDFLYRFIEAMKFLVPAKRIRVKANSKPWFNKDGKNFIKSSDLETEKVNFKAAEMHLHKMILKKKQSYFEELTKNKNKPKELWRL